MQKSRSLAVVVASLLVLTAAVGPASAAPWSEPTDQVSQVTFGADGTPSWHVHVEAGELATLESWANGSESRDIVRTHNASNYALVTASKDDAGLSYVAKAFDSGLAHKSYITSIRPNYQHSLAEPVTLQNASRIPAPGRFTRTAAKGLPGGETAEWSRSGIAYNEDANVSTLAETHGPLGVDNVTATGTGATIAVIDSGVNTADGQVFGNGTIGSGTRILNASKDFITNETVKADGLDAVSDPNGHGTFVAAQAAANASNASYDGIAPNADILALRALDADGQGSTSDIATAIRYAADHNADSIILSLGSPVYDQELTSALEYAVENNVTAIGIAAGNSRQMGVRWLATPADAPVDGVTAVAAANTTSNATAGVAYFSQTGEDPGATDFSAGKTRGQDIDVSAPGMKIEALVPTTTGSTTKRTLSGTSMAGPAIPAIAALGVETNEKWVGDAAAFNAHLRATARPMPNAPVVEAGQGMAAADRLLSNETGGSQAEAMDAAAERRNAFWTGLGDWKQSTSFNVPFIGA